MLAPAGAEHEALPVNEAFTLRGHDGPVLGVCFNKAGTYCLSCGKVSYMPAMYLSCCCWGRVNDLLCTALMPPATLQDRSIKLWNPHKGTLIKTYNGKTP